MFFLVGLLQMVPQILLCVTILSGRLLSEYSYCLYD